MNEALNVGCSKEPSRVCERRSLGPSGHEGERDLEAAVDPGVGESLATKRRKKGLKQDRI